MIGPLTETGYTQASRSAPLSLAYQCRRTRSQRGAPQLVGRIIYGETVASSILTPASATPGSRPRMPALQTAGHL